MRRFYTNPEFINKSTATLTGSEAKHIRQVLKLGLNDIIEVFDGTGTIYLTEIQMINKRAVEARIVKSITVQRKEPFLFVAQSMLKGKKMDFLCQKLTELSVEGIYPFFSQFSEAKSRQGKQKERWQRISLAACKQCKRPTVMQCLSPTSFKDLLNKSEQFDNKIIFWEKENVQFLSVPELIAPSGSTIILLGPEGGFSGSEIQQALANGFTAISLGPRILRAETAAIAATSIVQHMLGNLSRTDTSNWEISS